jgi:hypothetical protein
MLSPPTCVGLRYGLHFAPHAAFLESMESPTPSSPKKQRCDAPSPYWDHLWFRIVPVICANHDPSRGPAILLCHRLLQRSYRCRNINLLVIAYALRPRLSSRLTPGGLTWPGKPWVFGDGVSHSVYRYSLWHNLSSKLQQSFRSTFTAMTMLPYRLL